MQMFPNNPSKIILEAEELKNKERWTINYLFIDT